MVLLHVTAAVLVLKVELVTSLLIVLCGSLGDAVLGFVCGVFVVVVGIVDVNVDDDGDLGDISWQRTKVLRFAARII